MHELFQHQWIDVQEVCLSFKNTSNRINDKTDVTELFSVLVDVIPGLALDHDINVKQWMFTLPVMATYTLSPKVMLKAGPYVSLLTNGGFDGDAYNGYLRQDNPTGPKVEMAGKDVKHGVFEFDDDMRKVQLGIGGGADWAVGGRLGLCFELSWGLLPVFKSDFKTIKETLYPIYGTIGFTYQLN